MSTREQQRAVRSLEGERVASVSTKAVPGEPGLVGVLTFTDGSQAYVDRVVPGTRVGAKSRGEPFKGFSRKELHRLRELVEDVLRVHTSAPLEDGRPDEEGGAE